MIMMKKLSVITVASALVLTAGVAMHSFASANEVTDQQLASSTQMEELQNRVGTIYNEYGVFYRVDASHPLPAPEYTHTVYNDADVDDSTTVIMMDSGTFVKGKE
ncbi:hypothetical protein QE450_003759 [Paenibacillus sp. SORGH_AS306]|uniref:hypothetical protein n=1 Tax=unclassified Paenibacillus TaxID=185978 RepID=UPI00277F2F1C|nr:MULTISPECIES: hypothetical protein [unclassified Paenibacillus]MDQ1236261.1 hypothetical protein [Paenibacillus sp. SORGH_AS_0306]MDR6108615.1 hypothetical protein [Paenibacillus sp. SORGH_AS_0338]